MSAQTTMMPAGIAKISHSAGTVRPSSAKRLFRITRAVVGVSGCSSCTAFAIARPQSKAKYTPSEMSVPKIAPKVPRSRTWNQ